MALSSLLMVSMVSCKPTPTPMCARPVKWNGWLLIKATNVWNHERTGPTAKSARSRPQPDTGTGRVWVSGRHCEAQVVADERRVDGGASNH
jgi:hypothetical protein